MFNIPNLSSTQDNKDTHYTTLGISKQSSSEEIRRSYRKLSLEYHPDRNPGDTSKEEIYKKINEAYKVLSDDVERKNYDMLQTIGGHAINIDPAMFMNMFMNPGENNIINDLANIGMSKFPFSAMMEMGLPGDLGSQLRNSHSHFMSKNTTTLQKPESIHRTITLTLLETYNGCKAPISITRWKIVSDIKREQTETIYVTVPQGIDDNELITLENKGHKISDSLRGDIEIKILIDNQSKFERIGIDLIYKKSITLKESFCGFSFDLPYIDGREFKINNDGGNIIPPSFRKLIPKMGMQRDGDTGNLIIIFDVVYPKKFTKEQIEGLSKIL